jgi:hypothetical protein
VHGLSGLALPGVPVKPACPLLSEPSFDQGLLAMLGLLRMLLHHCFAAAYANLRIRIGAKHKPPSSNASGCAYVPQPLFEAAKRKAYVQPESGQALILSTV